jgi:hypothetical protein
MSLPWRIVIGLLSGMGSGLLGFWATWQTIAGWTGSHPGIGYDPFLVAAIFGPFVIVSLVVFRQLGILQAKKGA